MTRSVMKVFALPSVAATRTTLAPASIALLAASLAACSSAWPVTGRMQRSDESFKGTMSGSGYRSGSGQLVLASNRNVSCRGTFAYTSRRHGEGVLDCDDGRTGPFHVSFGGTTGTGWGDLDGKRYTFTFDGAGS